MLIYAPLNQIHDNPFQARQEYGEIDELAADIRRHHDARPETRGLQQVPEARLVGDDGLLVPTAGLDATDWLRNDNILAPGWIVQLGFGHRRRRAFEHLVQAGASEYALMPLHIRDLTDEQMLDGVWSENSQRRNLSAVEEAELLARKLERAGNQRAVAEAWGLARPTVANRLRLLQLPPEIQQANRDGRLSERQCLSLAGVVDLQQLADPKIEWHEDGRYAAPQSPASYILEVISGDRAPSSDQMRDYRNRALAHAGHDLPQDIANFNFDEDLDNKSQTIIQDNCRGCRYRVNNTCLAASCSQNKRAIYGARMVRQAASQLGYSPSSDPEHFKNFMTYSDDVRHLLRIHAGGGCGHLVIGWRDEGWAARPFADPDDPEYMHFRNDTIYDGDWQRGVILGHAGPITAECLAHAQTADDDDKNGDDVVVPPGVVDEWAADAKRQCRKIKAAVLDYFREALNHNIGYQEGLRGLMALGGWPQWRNGDDKADVPTIIKHLVGHMHSRGPMANHSQDQAFELYAAATEILNEAGATAGRVLDMAITGSDSYFDPIARDQALAARCRRILYYWYKYRKNYYGNHMLRAWPEIEKCQMQIQLNGPHGELAGLIPWLDVAYQDAATSVENDRISVCGDCRQDCDMTDMEYCAECKRVVCGDCYLESGHMQHDPERGLAYDDLVMEAA